MSWGQGDVAELSPLQSHSLGKRSLRESPSQSSFSNPSILTGLHPRWTTHTPSLAGSESPEPATREPPGTEGVASTVADTVTTVMGSSQPVVTHGTADNLIPVYCSILAAVVVGLVAYIAFKRYRDRGRDRDRDSGSGERWEPRSGCPAATAATTEGTRPGGLPKRCEE